MPPQDLLNQLRARPFQPFAIHAAGGTVYEVRHPELVMVGLASAFVGVPAPNQALPVYDRYEILALRHVTRLVPLEKSPASGNGN